jgi:dihydropteroate synthase
MTEPAPGGDHPSWQIRDRVLSTEDHTLIMGVVNTTPDSFSDGGRYSATAAALEHGLQLWNDGADIVDVGGESTRPGAEPVSADEELNRVVPVVAGLVDAGVVVSVDTMKVEVAEAAITAGAHIVNDITALGDPQMTALCATSEVGVVLMHMQRDPQTMQIDPRYQDLMAEISSYLETRAAGARRHGIKASSICIDPGIGFGKTHAHNLELLSNIDRLADLGYPVLIGTSRKGFLGAILLEAGLDTVAAQRDPATTATVALAIAGGAAVVRVHNVGHAFQAARAADAIVRASQRRL